MQYHICIFLKRDSLPNLNCKLLTIMSLQTCMTSFVLNTNLKNVSHIRELCECMGTGAVKIQNDNKSTINVLKMCMTCVQKLKWPFTHPHYKTFFFGTQKENNWRMLYDGSEWGLGRSSSKKKPCKISKKESCLRLKSSETMLGLHIYLRNRLILQWKLSTQIICSQ